MLNTTLAKVYVLLSVLAIGWFAYVGFTGRERGKSGRRRVPSEIRAAPNGLRTFHYWHVGVGGYRGGK